MKKGVDNSSMEGNGGGEKGTRVMPLGEARQRFHSRQSTSDETVNILLQENSGHQKSVVLFSNERKEASNSVENSTNGNDECDVSSQCVLDHCDQVERRTAEAVGGGNAPDSTLASGNDLDANGDVVGSTTSAGRKQNSKVQPETSVAMMSSHALEETAENTAMELETCEESANTNTEHGRINGQNGVQWSNGVDALGRNEEGCNPSYGPREKCRIIRNVVFLSTAFMIHFTAFVGATNLQSSINAAEGLGTVSLAGVYATLILSTIFLPAIMIKRLGCNGALLVAFVSYMPYIAAQFGASYYTVMPTAILVGLGGGPFWCAQCMYLCVVSDVYARITGVATEVIVVRFFGIFYMIYEFGQIFGNIISSTVLSTEWDDGLGNTSLDLDVRDICGANFCPGNDALANPNLQRPSDAKIYTISGIYLGCMALSCLVLLLGVDSLARYNEAELASEDPPVTGLELLRAAGRLLRDRNQTLLVPLTVWLGLEKAVIAADYTASYVSCAWGIQHIGYVMVCYGVANSLSALAGGWLVKLTGRTPVVLSAALLHVSILATLLLWCPHPQDGAVFFVMAGLWGAADGVWNVQVNALCGILSPGNEKAAYSSFRLWESVGYILAYGWSAYLCTDVKLYVVLGLLLLGMAGYLAIELDLRTKRQSAK